MAKAKCNRVSLAAKIKKLRKMKPKKKFKPLFKHMIELALHSASSGYCQRAGHELKYAAKVARY